MLEAFILLLIAYGFNDLMDGVNFNRKRNDGFWSIHQESSFFLWLFYLRNDAWHWSKKIMWTLIGYTVFGMTWILVLFTLVIYIEHDVLYHSVFKPLFKRMK